MPLVRNTTILLTTTLFLIACDREPKAFQMKVDKVQSMRGFVLNGLGVGGTVEHGCIANNDTFFVKRNGKVVFETKASVLSLDGQQGFEAAAGQNVIFYIRDVVDDTIKEGDTLEAEATTCGKAKAE